MRLIAGLLLLLLLLYRPQFARRLAGWRRDPDDEYDLSNPIMGASLAELAFPCDVDVSGGYVYVADTKNNRVVRWPVRWRRGWGCEARAGGSGWGKFL